MSAQAVTLHLPAQLYKSFKRRAEKRRHSVEEELLELVETSVERRGGLPAELAEAISRLSELDEPALVRAARERVTEETAERLEDLNLKAQREGLSASEERTRERLLRGYERVMLLRAEAARLLKERGHDVSSFLDAA